MSSKTTEVDERIKVDQAKNRVKKTIVSVIVIALVAISWACATQFSKSALTINRHDFYAPYSMVWFSTTFMAICYPVYVFYALAFTGATLKDTNKDAALVFSRDTVRIRDVLVKVGPFLVMWVAANYSYSYALGHISASAASSIMSSNTAMVCFLAYCFLGSVPSIIKIVGAFLAIAGVVVISLDHEFAGSWLGVVLVVFSALSAAFYKVLFKKVNGDANLGQVSLFMSMLGVLDLLINIWPTIVMVVTDADHIKFSAVPWLPLIGAGLLSLIFNFLVNFGIALLNPLVISVGMLCGIPVSAAIDIVVRGMPMTWTFGVSSMLFIVSFFLTTFPVDDWVLFWIKSSQVEFTAA
ncbi:unnamed protein product [Bursaphelenchus xylophilus]|uniref:(pine wood nematode) hypothetical protein n=1 Tax=Bursaphelenchus xylophilus TaxID=6326 RepID=A0A1I7RM37_BURXY|nr:unnamed protein product [Bursaphelenchus xylophilus]CAG9118178.1 unnamed protein product [Bursaphelenchus xylophilus]